MGSGRQDQRKGSKSRSGKHTKSGTKEVKTKDLEFRLGGQANVITFKKILDDIRHHMVEYSDSDYKEDIDHVLKYGEDPREQSTSDYGLNMRKKAQAEKAKLEAMDKEYDPDEYAAQKLVSEHQENLYRTTLKESAYAIQKRERNLDKDKRLAASKLYKRCEPRLQEKLRELNDWDSIEYDPIKLIPAIRELCTNYQSSRYAYTGYLAIFKSFFEFRQRQDESLVQYRDRAVTTQEQLKAVGRIVVTATTSGDGDVSDGSESSVTSTRTEEKKALDRLSALIMMMGADREYFGERVSELETHYKPDNPNFDMPASIEEAYEVLHSYKRANPTKFNKIAQARRDKRKKPKEEKAASFAQDGKKPSGCYKCGLPSEQTQNGPKPHRQWQCPLKGIVPDNENSRITNKLYYKDPRYAKHFKTDGTVLCQEDGTAFTQEEVNEALDAAELNMDDDQKKVSQAIRRSVCGASHVQFDGSFFQKSNPIRDRLIWKVLLDNQSTNSVFGNKALVRNIRKSSRTLELHTNGGVLNIALEADLPGYGTVWFDSRAITNILCFQDVHERAGVTFDPIENKFVVQSPIMNRARVEFKMDESNHYAYNVNRKAGSAFPQTTVENESFYTPRQIRRAKEARDFRHGAGNPSIRDLKAMITNNVIRGCPITIEDLNIAEDVYGKDIGTLKGKTTRSKPPPVVHDLVEVPQKLLRAQGNVDLCINILWICGLPFLSSISKRIMYRTLDYVPNLTLAAYRSTLDKIFCQYNAAGFTIARISCDRAFKPLLEPVKDELDVDMNFVSRDEHVPEAERNNRVVKERSRATYHRLPYARLPKQMVIEGFEDTVLRINWVCPKGGVSQRLSPHEIIRRRVVEWDKHCKHTFGDYCQAHRDGDNTLRARTLDSIYLRPEWNNAQAGHRVLNLQTGKVNSARRVTSLPITPNIIRRVEELAAKDKMLSYKFQSKYAKIHGIFHPYTAGVNEDEEDNEEEEDETTSSEEDESNTNSEADSDEDDDSGIVNLQQPELTDDGNDTPLVTDQECMDQDDYSDSESSNDSCAGRPTRRTDDCRHEQDDIDLDGTSINEQQDQTNDVKAGPLPEHTEDRPKKRDTEGLTARLREPPTRVPTRTRDPQSGRLRLQDDLGEPLRALDMDAKGRSLFQGDRVTTSDRELSREELNVLMVVIDHLNHCFELQEVGTSLHQTKNHSIKRALKKWGEEARQAALGEMRQLHDRLCIRPVKKSELTARELKEAMESFSFLIEKVQKQKLKSRHVADGSTQRPYVDKYDSASPTVSTDALFITAAIDAQEHRDVATLDIPNAFIQTMVPEADDGTRIIMRITGDEAAILMEMDPMYELHVEYELDRHGRDVEPVIYCHVTRAIYGMLQSALWFYKQWRADLETQGFVINPYDPCTANKMVDGKQLTVVWHVDDVKVSHVNPEVVDEFCDWTNKLYGDKEIGEVKPVRGTRHEYLGMYLDYSTPGVVVIDMTHYMQAMVDEYPWKLQTSAKTPSNSKLFTEVKSRKLDQKEARIFHTFVAKALYACKRARPDLMATVAYLCTRVKEPDVNDQRKLTRMMTYIRDHLNDNLRLEGGNIIVAGADAAFAVHDDMKSHTGVTVTIGKGSFRNDSRKQKLVTKSSCEAEIVAADTGVTHLLWTKWFCESQGYKVTSLPTLLQDNEAAIKLERRGKLSSSQRTRHINIRYFFITDNVERRNVQVQYFPTDQLAADFHSKPLQGAKFLLFKAEIMNLPKLKIELQGVEYPRKTKNAEPIVMQEVTKQGRH